MAANPLPANNAALTNDTTPVTIVAAPASSTQRLVRTITLYNADTDDVVALFGLVVSATTYYFQRQTLAPGQTMVFGDSGEVKVLDSTSKSIVVVLEGAITTNQCHATADWADAT